MKMGIEEITGNVTLLFPNMNDVQHNRQYWENNDARQKMEQKQKLRRRAAFDFNECLRTLRERIDK